MRDVQSEVSEMHKEKESREGFLEFQNATLTYCKSRWHVKVVNVDLLHIIFSLSFSQALSFNHKHLPQPKPGHPLSHLHHTGSVSKTKCSSAATFPR